MPKRTDISFILIIGQACEFDYSNTHSLMAPKD